MVEELLTAAAGHRRSRSRLPPRGSPGRQAVRARRRPPPRPPARHRAPARLHPRRPRRGPPAQGEPPDRHDAGPRPGGHHPGQRDRTGRRGRLLQGRRRAGGHHQRRGLPVRGVADGADLAAVDHRQERPRRSAVRPREAEPGPGADDRQPRHRLGRADRPRRDQGRLPARHDEAVHGPPGRGRPRTPGARHQRRRRTPGVEETRRGRPGDVGNPSALQLRLLQTIVAVAAEKNSTLVLPFPVELLRFLERAQYPTPDHAPEPDGPRPGP